MPDQPRVRELLDELLDRDTTPEEVCGPCLELLPVVRERWRQICLMRAELDVLLPVRSYGTLPTMPPEELSLPQVPGYEVEAVLGRGGMGVVFRARQVCLRRLVALKMTLAGSYAGPQERERFRREAEAVAALRHANIVQIYDVSDWAGRSYFTMELIEGGSLAQRLAGAPQPARQAAALLATLAEAMHAAHEGGIVHRDLKPGNILFTPDGTPKITDFGLARRLEGEAGLTLSGVPLGTPNYMAPEQARGQSRTVGPAVDVYALGAILYELLSGRPPFRAETPAETLRQVIDQEPVPPARLNARVPRDLETICLKCLQKEPHRRYASAAALADDLRRFGEGRPIRARPLGLAGRSWRWGRRNPAAAALMATALTSIGLAIGGGIWLQGKRAEQRAQTAGQEARESQAVEAALEQASALGRQGRWPDAQAVLKAGPSLLSSSAPANLRERLTQARLDANMAAKLEAIRLHLSTDPTKTHATAAPLYAEAFRSYYGIDLLFLEPEAAAARVGNSAIRETLLAYLHDWYYWALEADRAKLKAMLDRADKDPWRRAFRQAVAVRDLTPWDTKRMAELAALPEVLAQPPLILSGLGGVLLIDDRREQALALLREAQQLHPDDFWLNYLLGQYWEKENPQVAVGYFRAAVAIRPKSDEIYTKLGRALRDSGDMEGAIAAFRQGVTLNRNSDAATEFTTALMQSGRLKEARAAWAQRLELDPPEHDAWFGYAELCLFLGREDDYRRARRDLLSRFGATTDPYIAERTSRACLLLPATGNELRQAVALAERAAAVDRLQYASPYPWFLFAKGLAEYRQGQFEEAISIMRSDASHVLGPGPELVIAMALHQKEQTDEARKTLASAILSYDWSADRVRDVSGFIIHSLRREAERMILSNLPAFLDGKYQPRDNDECLAMLGACQFTNRKVAMARLYADAFAADPPLVDDLGAGQRYNAARAAALAGCGHGEDGTGLGEEERKRWRDQAREWLQVELAARGRALDADPEGARRGVREVLTRWRKEPDLACVRDPGELDKLASDERKDYLALWAEVAALLARCENAP